MSGCTLEICTAVNATASVFWVQELLIWILKWRVDMFFFQMTEDQQKQKHLSIIHGRKPNREEWNSKAGKC